MKNNLEDKEKDLDVNKQREILSRLAGDLMKDHSDMYYSSTYEISEMVYEKIHQKGVLDVQEYTLMKDLSVRDIQVLYGVNSKF